MAENRLDNTKLEAAIEEFVKDRQKDKYANIMELLEKSMVLVPTLAPQGLDREAQERSAADEDGEDDRKTVPGAGAQPRGDVSFAEISVCAEGRRIKEPAEGRGRAYHTVLQRSVSGREEGCRGGRTG